MSKQSVLLLGATGETGSDILNGLIEDGSFELSILVQPSSANKPAVLSLTNQGIKTVIADLSGSISDLTTAITGYHTIISAIGATAQAAELSLVDAAAAAGTKRFVPCSFITICPPSGIMKIRDDKEEVFQHIWSHYLPYTIIDVGLSSGKLDYASVSPKNEIYGDGNARTLLTDKRDIGRYVARIIKDERTLNQKVYTASDFISQNEIVALMERKSGEKIEYKMVEDEELLEGREKAVAAARVSKPGDFMAFVVKSQFEYNVSKYVRRDNTHVNAKYLGYLNAGELYPDFRPIKFEDYLDELFDGKGKPPYAGRF